MEYRGSGISVALYTDKGEVIRFVEVGKLTKQVVEVFNRWFGGITRLDKEDVIIYEKGVITGSIGGVKFEYNTEEAKGIVGDRYVSGLLGKELARLRKGIITS